MLVFLQMGEGVGPVINCFLYYLSLILIPVPFFNLHVQRGQVGIPETLGGILQINPSLTTFSILPSFYCCCQFC